MVAKQYIEKPSSSGSNSCLGETSVPCNAPKTSSQKNTFMPQSQVRQDNKRSSLAMAVSNTIFRPRPYEEIYAEQAYLCTSLQLQSSKAADLIRRYSGVEMEVATMEASKERRRLRKQLNLLRSRINEVAEQEKAIFLRLSELYMEAQSRDTFGKMHQQKVPRRERSSTGSCSSCSTISSDFSTCTKSSSSTLLSGDTPEFVPRSQAADARASMQIVQKFLPRAPAANSAPSNPETAVSSLETVDEVDEDFACNHGLSYQYKEVERMEEEEERPPKRPPRSEDLQQCRENRLSLPNLESLWPN